MFTQEKCQDKVNSHSCQCRLIFELSHTNQNEGEAHSWKSFVDGKRKKEKENIFFSKEKVFFPQNKKSFENKK